MRSYRVKKIPKITSSAWRQRQQCASALFNRLKGLDAGKIVIFQEKKFFTKAQYPTVKLPM